MSEQGTPEFGGSWIAADGTEPHRDAVLSLYERAAEGEISSLELHFKYKTFYATAAATLLGIPALALEALSERQWLACIFPFLAFVISWAAFTSTRRHYQRFLEHVTMKIKLEYLLGLDRTFKSPEKDIPFPIPFDRDPVVLPYRWAESRLKARTTEEWIKGHLHEGANHHARVMFGVLMVFAVFEFLLVVPIG